jgi:hypothetical protein
VSSTLERPRWSNATVLAGDVVDGVSQLKHELDGEIVVYAGYQLDRTLIEHDTDDQKPMRLLDTKTIGEGLVSVTYECVRED